MYEGDTDNIAERGWDVSHEIIELSSSDGSWDAFKADWAQQCESFNEEFETYAEGAFSVVEELIEAPEKSAGVYACRLDGRHVSMCQVNVKGLPGYDSPVMRVRFLTLSPEFDFGDKSVDEYAKVLVVTLASILALSDEDGPMKAKYLKFHLSSPADRQFFALLGQGLNDDEDFTSVTLRGSWLYITKA